MMKISAALIDDEPFALARVRKLILQDSAIEVVGEVSGAADAIKMLQFQRPEIIFLDIKMPDGTGFDVLLGLPKEYKPYIVFITAYDDFALKAFEYNAIDYLLKPFDNSRFFNVIEKAKEFISLKNAAALNDQILELINRKELAPSAIKKEQIKIMEKGWDIYIDLTDVVLFEANGNYCKIHLKQRFYLYKKTMKELVNELNTQEYLRIHRSYIVNLNQVNNVDYQGKNEYSFELSNGQFIVSGRSFAPEIKKYMSFKIKC